MSKKEELPLLIFELTEKCNQDCLFCYNIHKRYEEFKSKEISFTEIYRTLKCIYSKTKVKHITFSGGEPLLINRLPELVLFSRLKGSTVSILTNGAKQSQNQIQDLIKAGTNLFQIPALSFEEGIHDKLTQIVGSWQRAIHSIKEIISLNGKIVANIVLTKINIQDISSTIIFIKSLGINNVMINRFNIGGAGIKNKEKLLINNNEWSKIFQIINDTAEKHFLSVTSNVCFPFCILNPDKYNNIKFSSCAINKPNKPITISANGDLRICNHSPIILGNIFNNSINNLIESEYIQKWKNTIPLYCKECAKFAVCFGGCRAASEQFGKSLEIQDPILK